MPDVPFGFSAGDDPDRDKNKKDPSDPFGLGSGGEFNMNDLGQIFTRLGQMFSGAGGAMGGGPGSSGGAVNYDLARQLASNSIGFVAPIPPGTESAISDAVRLAETWLDGATALPAGTTRAAAWTPTDWIDNTLDTWKRLCDPVAEQISAVWASALPEEAKAMAGPLLSMISQMGGMAFGSQLGQALGRLSREVLTSTDIGLPLGPKGVAALLPEAVEEFSAGLEQPRSEILTFLAAREAAHHRLFSHVPWLSSQLLTTVEAYAKGIKIDMSGIEELAQGFNPAAMADPAEMEKLLNQGIFEPKASPEQSAALERLETLLALIEGWVQTVVTAALGERIPGAAALGETLRRRRASGGPAEQTFATLVGLELRPRKLREAATLWERLTEAAGMDARDAVWQHPDLLPSAEDLDEPAAFIDRAIGGDTSGIDKAIAELEKSLAADDDAGRGTSPAEEPRHKPADDDAGRGTSPAEEPRHTPADDDAGRGTSPAEEPRDKPADDPDPPVDN